MSLVSRAKRIWRHMRNPGPPLRHEPSEDQKAEITEAIRKQRFRGDMVGRLEYRERRE